MKKFKLPKVKIKFPGLKGVFNYISLIFISSVILGVVLISLPLTERVSSSATYDLVNKNRLYWAKEYILELDTESSLNKEQDIERTRSILQRRLRNFGVEQSSVALYKEDDVDFLKVSIQTSKPLELVEGLIKSPYIVQIVTRKDDVDFENEEDPIAPYLTENYEPTKFTRDFFRNVYITQLRNSANEYSYFALFKTWPFEKDWTTFINDYSGQTVGVSIDGFVTPVQISASENLFAVPVPSTEKENAHIISLLYNSGVIPISYTTISEEEIEIESAEIDYIKLTEGILVAILFIYIYLLFIEKTPKDVLIKSGISTIITVAAWIAYLKMSETPVDIFLLALEVITIVAVIRIITENAESRVIVTVLLALISSICVILGSGYVKIFANDLLILMILSNLTLSLSTYYIFNVKRSLKI